MEWEYSRLHSE